MPEEHPMTDVTAELEPVLAGTLALLREKPEMTLDELAARVVAAAPDILHAEAEPFPKLPKHVELTTEVQRALPQLVKVFNSVEIKDRRSLTQNEIDLLTIEQAVISLVGATMAARLDVIKETVRVHMDVAAEEAGIAVPKAQISPAGEVIVPATLRDQKGHYLLAAPLAPHQVQAGPVRWSQEFSQSAPKPSQGLLEEAVAAGDIERADYLAVTREVRVIDTGKLRELIRTAPARGLAVLRRITVAGRPQSSLTIRKQT
jgi:hypothetical protein